MLQTTITSFSYSEKEILKDLSFQLKKGEHLVILGESGCGKSTLLHIIYGLLHLEHGHIFWNEKKLLGPRHNLVPGEPFIKLVAQEFNVMPFISVSENIATHLSRLDLDKDADRVSELLEVVDLVSFKDEIVKNLSGGQKQRVALAKALAKEPELLLLDEPFSNIDSFRKNKLRRNLFRYLKKNKISCITATHDSEEALAFSDTVLMLQNGKKTLYGVVQEVYQNIKTPYQASFFGDVTMLPAGILSKKKAVLLPHQLMVSQTITSLEVTVLQSYFKGSHYLIEAEFTKGLCFFNHPTKLAKGHSYFLKNKA
ncbi:MAG: ABC transporter ATP-binding protein [Bacteroidetes bacterium]|nr:ABC transporter ATP-binding protein [Bacteroidota bacterium]